VLCSLVPSPGLLQPFPNHAFLCLPVFLTRHSHPPLQIKTPAHPGLCFHSHSSLLLAVPTSCLINLLLSHLPSPCFLNPLSLLFNPLFSRTPSPCFLNPIFLLSNPHFSQTTHKKHVPGHNIPTAVATLNTNPLRLCT
jgi:hypothetical protein